VTNVTAGLSGGSNNTSFRLSGNFAHQSEILTISGGSTAGNLAFNLNHRTTDQKVSVDFSSIYTHGSTQEVNQYGLAATLPPNAPPIYNSKGALNYSEWDPSSFLLFGDFPFAPLLQTSKSSTNTVNSNLSLNYRPIKGLELKASIGYRTTVNNSQAFNPIIAQDPINKPTGSALFTTTSSGGWIFEPQLTYTNPAIGPGKLSFLLGASVQSSDSRYNVENGTGYTNDELLQSILNAPVQAAYDAYGQYKYSGVFARLNYDIANKYILNLNGRRDGSSRFGPGFQFGNFGSVAGAWVASEEKWLRPILPAFISFLKFRASYGITGSDGVPEYQYLSQWVSGSGNSLIPSYNGVARPVTSLHAVNQYFHWQANQQLTEAIEMDFLPDSRMTLTLEHYRNRCSNQLLQYPTANFTGFNQVTANWPATVQNSGYEVSLTANILRSKAFKWVVSGNISFNTNKLEKYDGLATSPYFNKLLVGKSLSAQYLYHYLGVDPLTGQYSFQDYNHDGVITATGNNYPPLSKNVDNNHVVNLNPKYTGGFTTQFIYKGLGLALLFDYTKQIGKNAFASGTTAGALLQNQPAELVNNHWQRPGDNTKYMQYTTGTNSTVNSMALFNSSDGVYTDASFIRLSNLSFSYNMPEKAAKKMGMRGCNIYINAQNVFVFTKYKGVDPELQSFNTMPQAKIFTGGISFNF
jgi:TonB-linked SusC/RagA family outer membrane protein